MSDFLITRTALNLFLIVALAIQPVAPCLASLDRGACCRASRSAVTNGCQCCLGETAIERGCCCGKQVEEATATPSCCSGNDHSSTVSATIQGTASSDSEHELVAVDRSEEFRSICLCGRHAPPLKDSSPRSRSNEHRPPAVDVISGQHDAGFGATRLAFASFGESAPAARAHFSQVHLCIWRL